jgi:hypothetical protein
MFVCFVMFVGFLVIRSSMWILLRFHVFSNDLAFYVFFSFFLLFYKIGMLYVHYTCVSMVATTSKFL